MSDWYSNGNPSGGGPSYQPQGSQQYYAPNTNLPTGIQYSSGNDSSTSYYPPPATPPYYANQVPSSYQPGQGSVFIIN